MKPILFNTKMVRAILEDRKTVTRRVFKDICPKNAEWGYTIFTPKGKISCRYDSPEGNRLEGFYKPPYQVGDVLYVRETWAKDDYNNYVYKADYVGCTLSPKWKWKPSIHMPKEAARIFLRVTDVKVERLQDMTADDAHKEGIDIHGENLKAQPVFSLERFEVLWDSTVPKKDIELYGWEANPWVWVIEFEKGAPDEKMS